MRSWARQGHQAGRSNARASAGNVLMALAAIEDMPKPLSLEYALIVTELFARTGDERFDAAAVRWLGRLIDERKPTLAGVRLAADALAALPDETAGRLLRDLARRR